MLICVYRYDDLDLFKQAIQSILENSHQPEKILLIVDGPVSTEMHRYIVDWVSVQRILKSFGRDNPYLHR